MRNKTAIMAAFMAGAAVFAVHSAAAQTAPAATAGAKSAAKARTAQPASAPAKESASQTITVAQDALGMRRLVTEVDAINTMQFWGASSPGSATKIDYFGAFGYNPPGMRLEITHTAPKGEKVVQEVNEKYSWDGSQIGAGFDNTGTVTPAMSSYDERILWLWTLPYGALKAAVSAGDKVQLSTENGARVLAFPLSGRLEGVTERVTLDSKNLIVKVETRTDDASRANLVTESDYSDYADLGDIKSDVLFPGHIVRKQGGHTVLDMRVSKVDPNNPYVVFPTPDKVAQAAK